MNKPILLILFLLVALSQTTMAQYTPSQAAAGASRSATSEYSPRAAEYRSAETQSYSNANSQMNYAASPGYQAVDLRATEVRDRGSYSTTMQASGLVSTNSAKSYSNNFFNNSMNISFTPVYTGVSYAGFSPKGKNLMDKNDTASHCMPWTPLQQWLAYRWAQRHFQSDFSMVEYPLTMFSNPSSSFVTAVHDYVVPENIKVKDMHTFFDGYIVYCGDTAYGMVNLGNQAVYFDGGDLQLNIPYKQRGLKSVVLFNDNSEELFLTRIGDSKFLSRVLHNGRLVVYDNFFSFDKSDFSVATLGTSHHNSNRQPLVILDPRARMIKTINRVYGSKLNPQDYYWTDIIHLINKLD